VIVQRNELATQQEPSQLAYGERRTVLAVLGFTPQQMAALLEQDVTVDQLRGMLRLRQCEGAPATTLAEIAARIDRIEELEKVLLDSHAV
jgi:hypothetical protein